MTKEEVIEAVNNLLKDTDSVTVAAALTRMYLDDKLTINDLAFCVNICGFELMDEFVHASKEEQRRMVLEAKSNNNTKILEKRPETFNRARKKDEEKRITQQELRELVLKQLEESDPVDVADFYVHMYLEQKLDLEGTKFAVGLCGFELTDEFLQSTFEEQKRQVESYDNEAGFEEDDYFEEEDEKE